MSPKVILVEPQEAIVDDVHLSVSDEQNATGYDLTDDQVDRLKAVEGVKLRAEGESQSGDDTDPIDKLTKRELNSAVAAAKLEVPDDASDDDKRAALKEFRASQEGGGE